MNLYGIVAEKLNDLGIEYEIVSHEPALTTEQADKFIEGIEGVRTKTMFLTNKKKTAWFLVIMDDGKRLDMESFAQIAGEKRVKMASENSLHEKMQLPPGVVSPFGLLLNEDHDIRVFIDQEIISQPRMSFHPNTNEKTIFISTEDLLHFIESIGYESEIVTL